VNENCSGIRFKIILLVSGFCLKEIFRGLLFVIDKKKSLTFYFFNFTVFENRNKSK